MSEADVATRIGLAVSDYLDVENHPDDLSAIISLGELKILCEILALRLVDILRLEPLDADLATTLPADLATLPRHALVHQRREALGMSSAELADAIGFEERVIQEVETDANYLDTLPLQMIADMARVLELPLVGLIGSSSSPK